MARAARLGLDVKANAADLSYMEAFTDLGLTVAIIFTAVTIFNFIHDLGEKRFLSDNNSIGAR